ncbi:MAG: OmpA-OmpF porin, family [Pseudomonadota bacterium]|jgi:OmpA-OmpF porin, OOP family|nr:OmpA-OmpF porin, family [Pseudomonadota bacterium]MDQ5905146.1 OmpA-OmpF porin, family [Pseudomonadota bacterium]MDQ5914432.1 OmpA-OmpF porin, family [Pseudomonadota bacterium]MDQ5918380.1 OmpA-OmpF porin, family [Pseudomonadota bacterium]MDQ5961018.1 OmpA-OmpF porin, family [Pseudomonadota bacterium]
MKKIAKQSLMAVVAAAMGLGAAVAQAQTTVDRVYAIDARNEVVMSGAGLCWRTGFWTPAGAANDPAGCKCDKDLLPKEKCEPKAATPVAGPKPASSKVTLAADALFDFDKAVLRPEGKKKLDDLVAKSKSLNLEVIIAVGHTDRLGKDAYNQKLSEKRAAAVKTYLVGKGLEANKVYTEGKGSKQPVTGDKCKGAKSKKTIECLQPDRRVDIEIIGTQK